MKRRCFVVVTSQRTGSTLLIRSLDSAPRVFCAGELFHTGPNVYHREFQFPHKVYGSRTLARLIDLGWSNQRVRNHLRWFYEYAGTGKEAVGFKVMASQIRQYSAIMPALKMQGVDFLYLYREDSFATALSYYKAKESGVFHSNRVARAPEQPPVPIDEKLFGRLINDCRSDKAEILRLHKVYGGLLLTYESMTSQWEIFMTTVGAAIGVPDLHVQKALAKLESGIDSVSLVEESVLRDRFGGEMR